MDQKFLKSAVILSPGLTFEIVEILSNYNPSEAPKQSKKHVLLPRNTKDNLL